jgi:Na+/melibiose symporter-like transporter
MNPVSQVIGLVKAEFARRARGWKRSIIAGSIAALFLTAALIFVLIAIFLFLADAYGAPAGALIMSAGLLVLGVIAVLIASMQTRKRDLQADIQAVAAAQMDQLKELKQLTPGRINNSTLLTVLGIAFVVGLISGRRQR